MAYIAERVTPEIYMLIDADGIDRATDLDGVTLVKAEDLDALQAERDSALWREGEAYIRERALEQERDALYRQLQSVGAVLGYPEVMDTAQLADTVGKGIRRLESERDALARRKDEAYEERNKVVSALARLFPSGRARTKIPGWDEEWHGCVYIDLPTGQVSWHYHDSQAHLFADLPPYQGMWDGHDTLTKYARLAELRLDVDALARRVAELEKTLREIEVVTGDLDIGLGTRVNQAYELATGVWLDPPVVAGRGGQ